MKEVLILKETIHMVRKADDIFSKIKSIAIDYAQENALIFYLNTRNKLIDVEVVFKGGLNSCIICPKTIFRKALLKKANSIIFAHNHPSGALSPSDEDMQAFKALQTAGHTLDVEVLDFIIFNKKEFYSVTNQ